MLDSCLVKVLWHERALNHKKDIQLCNSCRRSWEYLLDEGATEDFFADLFALEMDISGLLVFFSPFNPFGVAMCNWLSSYGSSLSVSRPPLPVVVPFSCETLCISSLFPEVPLLFSFLACAPRLVLALWFMTFLPDGVLSLLSFCRKLKPRTCSLCSDLVLDLPSLWEARPKSPTASPGRYCLSEAEQRGRKSSHRSNASIFISERSVININVKTTKSPI